jgi:hypothetical protein
LIIGLEKPFLKKTAEGSWEAFRSLLISPNVPHECDAADQLIFTLSIDPESSLGEYLQQFHLLGCDFVKYPETRLDYFDRSNFISYW